VAKLSTAHIISTVSLALTQISDFILYFTPRNFMSKGGANNFLIKAQFEFFLKR